MTLLLQRGFSPVPSASSEKQRQHMPRQKRQYDLRKRSLRSSLTKSCRQKAKAAHAEAEEAVRSQEAIIAELADKKLQAESKGSTCRGRRGSTISGSDHCGAR